MGISFIWTHHFTKTKTLIWGWCQDIVTSWPGICALCLWSVCPHRTRPAWAQTPGYPVQPGSARSGRSRCPRPAARSCHDPENVSIMCHEGGHYCDSPGCVTTSCLTGRPRGRWRRPPPRRWRGCPGSRPWCCHTSRDSGTRTSSVYTNTKHTAARKSVIHNTLWQPHGWGVVNTASRPITSIIYLSVTTCLHVLISTVVNNPQIYSR